MLKRKIAYTSLLVVFVGVLMGATYVIHNMSTGVMHQSQDVYSTSGVAVSTELGTIEAKLSEHQVDIDSIESAVGTFVTKAYVNGTDEILTTAVDSIEIALSSSGSLPTKVGSLEVGIAGVGKLGNNQTWTGNNIFSNLVDGTASVALYAPSAGNANYSLTSGTSAVAINANTASEANKLGGYLPADFMRYAEELYVNKIVAGSYITSTPGADSREITVAVNASDFVLQSAKAYLNKLIAGSMITLTPGADTREVTIAVDSADLVKKSDKAYINKVIAGANITVTPGADSREVTITGAAAPSALTKLYGDTDSTGTTGNYATIQGGTGITVTRTGDSLEVAATAAGSIARVYANDDGAYSAGPNISLKQGSNVTITRSGDTFEIASTASGGQSLYDAVVDAAGGGDYTTLASAMNTLSAGAAVFVKDGTYNETTAIKIETGDAIIGQSPGGVIIDFDGSDTSDGIYAVGGAGTELVGIWLKNLVVRDCTNDTAAIFLKYCDKSNVENVSVKDCGFSGADGFKIEKCDYNNFSLDILTNINIFPFHASDSCTNEISIGSVENNPYGHGIYMAAGCSGNKIKFNSINGFKDWGFAFMNCSGNTAEGNHVGKQISTSGGAGVLMYGGRNTVKINEIVGCRKYGLYLVNCFSSEVSVNNLKNYGTSVYVDSSRDNTINIGEATTNGAYSVINVTSSIYNIVNGCVFSQTANTSSPCVVLSDNNTFTAVTVNGYQNGVLSTSSTVNVQKITTKGVGTNTYMVRCDGGYNNVTGGYFESAHCDYGVWIPINSQGNIINISFVLASQNDSAVRALYWQSTMNNINVGQASASHGTYDTECTSSGGYGSINGSLGKCNFGNAQYFVVNGVNDSIAGSSGTGFKNNSTTY